MTPTILPAIVVERVQQRVLRAARAYAKRGLDWNRDRDATHPFYVGRHAFSIQHRFSDGPAAVDEAQAGEVLVVPLPQGAVCAPEAFGLQPALVVFGHDGRGEVYWVQGAGRSRAPAAGADGPAPSGGRRWAARVGWGH